MRRLSLVALLVGSFGCATTSPRFEQDVATTFAQDDMHKLETDELELYYPANYEAAAKQVAARAAECIRLLRAHDVDPRPRDKALLFLTSANYNNAYVGGQTSGEPLQSLVPLTVTSEMFHFYGLGGANVGDIACHEMFHYVHYEQTHGFWLVVNTVLGPVLPPQAFLERWFTEGVAQYYEGRLRRNVGRPFSPFYRGSFDSFVAMRGGVLQPGDLQLNQRELYPHSGAYLTGLHFVEWLARTYGEEKLWQVIDLQANSVFSPFGYTLRFKSIYGASVGALVDEWSAELKKGLVVRQRPASEKVLLDDVGQLARVATHAATGVTAIVSSGNEQVPLLRVLEADGRVRFEKRLAGVGTDRPGVYVGPGSMSGLSFSGDGSTIYLLNDDLIARGDTLANVWRIDAQTGAVLKVFEEVGRGMGGSVSSDGRTFTFADFPVDGPARIVERDLEAGSDTVVQTFAAGVSIGAPAWNPSHTRLVYSRLDANGWNLVMRDEEGVVTDLTTDGAFNYGARWADDTHLVFARTAGKYLQAHRLDVAAPTALERLSDSPWGVLDVSATPSGVIFAARDGIHWSIDAAPGTALETISLAPPEGTEPTPIPEFHEPAPLVVKSDEPYSGFDHLFVPQLRVPVGSIGFSTRTDGSLAFNGSVGLSLMGRDRLSRNTWAINALIGVPDVTQNQVFVGYRNLSLAPWMISATASRDATSTEAYWTGALSVSRSIFSVPLSFGLQTEVCQPFDTVSDTCPTTSSLKVMKFIGPFVSLSWGAGDSTAYAGAQRTLSVSLDVAGYPAVFGSDRDMLDLRGEAVVSVPLPISKRHSFRLSAAGRALPGAPTGAMRVGGVSSGLTLLEFGTRSPFPAAPGVFLPGALIEPLRGYDDFAIRAQHVATFNARYRYSFIVDRGTASVLWILPSFFMRQIDVEAFGSAAFTESQQARAVGAAVLFRTSFGGFLPVSLGYQFAWRFDFGLPPLHVLALSFD